MKQYYNKRSEINTQSIVVSHVKVYKNINNVKRTHSQAQLSSCFFCGGVGGISRLEVDQTIDE